MDCRCTMYRRHRTGPPTTFPELQGACGRPHSKLALGLDGSRSYACSTDFLRSRHGRRPTGFHARECGNNAECRRDDARVKGLAEVSDGELFAWDSEPTRRWRPAVGRWCIADPGHVPTLPFQ